MVIARHTQLRLAHRHAPPVAIASPAGSAHPARIRCGFRNFRAKITCPARVPKPGYEADGLSGLNGNLKGSGLSIYRGCPHLLISDPTNHPQPHGKAAGAESAAPLPAPLAIVSSETTPASKGGEVPMESRIRIAAALVLALGVAACGGGGGVSARTATDAYGPITIWYSNNAARGRLGRAGGRFLEQEPPGPAGLRGADPFWPVVGGGNRCRDHGRHRAMPDLQHLSGVGAGLREAGRPGAAQRLPRRCRLHRGAHRTRRQRLQVAGRPCTTSCRGNRTRS